MTKKNTKPLGTDSGFELDKIDPGHLPPPPSTHEIPGAVPHAPADAKPAVGLRSIPKKLMIALTTASVLLVVLTGLLLIDSNTVRLHLPFFGTNIHKKPDTYVSVGPVITSVDSGDLIKMTLDINCSKKSYRKTVRELDSRVRSRIIWALQTPTAAGLLRSGDYMGLRRYLAARVKEVFPKGMVTEIYISQFLRY